MTSTEVMRKEQRQKFFQMKTKSCTSNSQDANEGFKIVKVDKKRVPSKSGVEEAG